MISIQPDALSLGFTATPFRRRRDVIVPPVNGKRGRVFSYEEAMSIFPVVRDRTSSAVRALRAIAADATAAAAADESEAAEDESEAPDLETAYREVVESWASEIESLGCEVKGLWLVDWDAGDGYFCWKYPEPALGHYHGYDEGFAGRVPIT